MKLFAIFAILFFTWRVFAQGFDYYYIEDYMRAQEDKNYAQYLAQKEADMKRYRMGVDEYKDEKFYDLQMQEQARNDYAYEKSLAQVAPTEKIEKEYEKQAQKEQTQHLALEKQYALEKEDNIQTAPNYWSSNSRMVASLETRKRVPRKDRKFKFKNQRSK